MKEGEYVFTTVVDQGCGSGALAIWLAREDPKYVQRVEREGSGKTQGGLLYVIRERV